MNIYLDISTCRLGNNLFRLFSAMSFCRENNYKLYLDNRWFMNDKIMKVLNINKLKSEFGVPENIKINEYYRWSDRHYGKHDEQCSIKGISKVENVRIVDASLLMNYYNIFKPNTTEDNIKFNKETKEYLLSFFKPELLEYSKNNKHKYVIIVRNYYTKNKNNNKLYEECNLDYYLNAMEQFGISKNQIKNDENNDLDIVIVSDYNNVAKEKLGSVFKYAKYLDECYCYDLMNIISADKVICTNSSFAIIGALLNDNNFNGETNNIIRPSKYYIDPNFSNREEITYYNSEWKIVDVHGEEQSYVSDIAINKEVYLQTSSTDGLVKPFKEFTPPNIDKCLISIIPKCSCSTITSMDTDIIKNKNSNDDLSTYEWHKYAPISSLYSDTNKKVKDTNIKKYIIWRDPIERIFSAYQYPIYAINNNGGTLKNFNNIKDYLLSVKYYLTKLFNTIQSSEDKNKACVDTNILNIINIHVLPQYLFYYNIYKKVLNENNISDIEIVQLKDLTPFIENTLGYPTNKNHNHINKTPDNNKININDTILYTKTQIKELNNLLDEIRLLYKEDYRFFDVVNKKKLVHIF